MIPSREHFLLKRRNALSTFSFSPTLTVDILFTILCLCVYSYSVIITIPFFSVKPFYPFFPTFFLFFHFQKIGIYHNLSAFLFFCRTEYFHCAGLNKRARNLPQGVCTKGKRNRGASFPPRAYNRKFYIPTPWVFCFLQRAHLRLSALWV